MIELRNFVDRKEALENDNPEKIVNIVEKTIKNKKLINGN